MENINDLEVEEVPEIVETFDENDNPTTDWQTLALQNQGIAKRYKTKLEKIKESQAKVEAEAKAKAETPPPKKEGFDYAEKAYLKSSGITPDEFPFVKEVMDSTGKSLDEVLEAKYFQAELKEKREAAETKAAIPSGSKRSTTVSKDSEEYWLAKGELPPADQVELRRKVVNALAKNSGNKSPFADIPIIK